MRDELGSIFTDERFAPLFPVRGQPAEAPWRLALITLLQFAEGLSDRQAAEAVRGRIDWKYVLALPLADAGFDSTVLCEFRARLVAGEAEQALLDAVLDTAAARHLVRAGGRQRTDSTHVLAAVRALNRVACVIETMRHALAALAVAAPDWLVAHMRPDWSERYESRAFDGRLPKSAAKRDALVQTVGIDGHHLLKSAFATDAPEWLRQLPAVETLRRVWVQQFYLADDAVRWRTSDDGIPPAAQFISSPYDLEAHYARKRTTSWIGYKAHLTETCDNDLPRLITHVQTMAAPVPDDQATSPAHAALAAKGLLPAQHLVDTGYIDAGLLVETRQYAGLDLIGPVRRDLRWQAKAGKGFAAEAFVVDWDAEQVTCPSGARSISWTPATDNRGTAVIKVKFSRKDCSGCVHRSDCAGPEAQRRVMTLRTREQHAALIAARQRQQTSEFAELYGRRAGIKATISLAVRGFGLRRTRYIGQAKTHLQHVATAAAINLARLARWLAGEPIASTRQTRFAHLVATAAAA